MIRKYWWIGIAMMGLMAWSIAQGLEFFGQWPACRLCHIERWIFLTLGILGLGHVIFSKIYGAACWEKMMGWGIMLATGIGAGVAGYHTAIQFHWIALPTFCQLPDADTFQHFMALPTATCDQWTMTFLFLPVPVYLFFLWMGMTYMTYTLLRKKNRINNRDKPSNLV